jgi:hypothetical protein
MNGLATMFARQVSKANEIEARGQAARFLFSMQVGCIITVWTNGEASLAIASPARLFPIVILVQFKYECSFISIPSINYSETASRIEWV